MTNYAAIKLAEERQLIEQDAVENIPFLFMIDSIKRKIKCSLWDEENEDIKLLNRFQSDVYSAFESHSTVSISAPTSAGKSFIMLEMIKRYLDDGNTDSIAYIVPTRALIQQVYNDITKLIKSENYCDVIISAIPVLEEVKNRHIFIFTQERMLWFINQYPKEVFGFVLVDEAQKIGDDNRGVLLQQVVEQLVRSETKIVFASPMTENPELLFDTTKQTEHGKAVKSEQVTVNQNLLYVNTVGTGSTKWELSLCNEGNIQILGSFSLQQRCSSVMKRLAFVAYALGSETGGNLIYANGAADAEKIANILYDMERVYENDEEIDELVKLIEKTVHRLYGLRTVLKRRVAFHYGNMPLIIRLEIERLFKNGKIKFLVCTSTLMEGVNLPAKSIFLRGPQRGRNKPLSEVDFWNLAGRAGRQGKEFQGNIICIDSNNENVWKNGIYKRKVKFPIKSTINDLLVNNINEIIVYMANDKEGRISKRNLQYDQAVSYLLNDKYYNQMQKAGSKIDVNLKQEVSDMLLSIEELAIPANIVVRHHGISPYAQQRLYNYFVENKKSEEELLGLIPVVPEDSKATECYVKIIGRVTKYLEENKFGQKLTMYRAILVVNWMRGYHLARIIEGNIRYHKNKNDNKNTAAIIRDTMRDIEEYARFKFVKFSSCYIDLLKVFFLRLGREDLNKKISDLNLWLEFGVSQKTQISLMSMGFSRTAAIALSDYISSDEYSVKECKRWLFDREIKELDLSHIILREIEQIKEKL